MKTIFKMLSTLLLTARLLSSCVYMGEGIQPSKKLITRDYKVKEFNKIDAGTVGDIYYTQSADGKTDVQIYGPDNIVALIQVAVKDSTLLLSIDKSKKVRNFKKMKITITSPTLNSISFKGVGDVHIDNGLTTDNLYVESKGVGDVKIKSLTCSSLNVQSMGVGNVKLAGTVQAATLHSKGVGNIEAGNLQANIVEASSQGVGDITCNAVESINAAVRGVGSIKYKGNPTIKSLNKKGVGTIKNI
ncbi:head GIN domain-containing protein [Bacteroides fragilis]|uniref:head GIN domain-containing protein n=1 Tax=Bacteroides fragilis TaxID=817 RepID=UPI001C73831A|nr:head GIN domain-containing protein [Bacteroides fragilis]